jgi:hypothetical protein
MDQDFAVMLMGYSEAPGARSSYSMWNTSVLSHLRRRAMVVYTDLDATTQASVTDEIAIGGKSLQFFTAVPNASPRSDRTGA